MPSSANCGSQKRLRLGSLPTMTCSIDGAPRTSAAAYDAKSARASSVSGVVADPGLMTVT